MFGIFSSNASAVALLRDEEFLLKYPALARALRETVEPLPNASCTQEPLQKHRQPVNGTPKAGLICKPTSTISCDPEGENRVANAGEPQLLLSKSDTRHAHSSNGIFPRGALPLSNEKQSNFQHLSSDSIAGASNSVGNDTSNRQIPSKSQANLEEGNVNHGSSTGGSATDGNRVSPVESLDPPYHYMKRYVSFTWTFSVSISRGFILF